MSEHLTDEELARSLWIKPDVRKIGAVLQRYFAYQQDDPNAFTWLAVDAYSVARFMADGRTVTEALEDTGLVYDCDVQAAQIASFEAELRAGAFTPEVTP